MRRDDVGNRCRHASIMGSGVLLLAVACAPQRRAVDPAAYRDDQSVSYADLMAQLDPRPTPHHQAEIDQCSQGDDWSCFRVGVRFESIAAAHPAGHVAGRDEFSSSSIVPGPPIQTAIRLWEGLCKKGVGAGCYKIGLLYTKTSEEQILVQDDELRAQAFFERSCEAPVPSGEGCHDAGIGLEKKDLARAISLWDRGCRFGIDREMSTSGTWPGGSRETCEDLAAMFRPDHSLHPEVPADEQRSREYTRLGEAAEQRITRFHDTYFAERHQRIEAMIARDQAAHDERMATMQSISDALRAATASSAPAGSPNIGTQTSQRLPAQTSPGPSTGGCPQCSNPPQKAACASGTQSACYEAAAWTCQCHRDHQGKDGCGGSPAVIDDCIKKNTAAAARYRSNAPAVDGKATKPTPPPNPSPTTKGGPGGPNRGGAMPAF